jgi:UDP-N-acetylglucosamine--N-acetylmuramyl-(pentapeptide) pyrophosphoryl-undecaprenol N-acetylglucosamine transferase
VLVLGGSQGAQALNERMPDAMGRLVSNGSGLQGLEVTHQAGAGRDAAVRDAYARAGLPEARVIPFSTDLANDLAWADVVVARAGAGTIAEIAAVGRASILVPYPHAADDHQAKNAAAYANTGSAVWVRQEAADGMRLSMEVHRLLSDDVGRHRLARNACAQGRPEAARTIARDLVDLAEVS